jgi:hypothetical protein
VVHAREIAPNTPDARSVQIRLLLETNLLSARAAGMEPAPFREVDKIRNSSRDSLKFPSSRGRERFDETDCIRVLGIFEKVLH